MDKSKSIGLIFANICHKINKLRQRKRKHYQRKIRFCVKQYTHNQQKLQVEMVHIFESIRPYVRNLWMRERSDAVWLILKNGDEQRWKEAFRINKSTFQLLVEKLNPFLRPKENPISTRQSITVEKQIAITLYKLASCCEYRVVGDVFGIHKSTVHKVFHRVVNCIKLNLAHSTIKFPDAEEAERISNSFENRCGLPMIIGCIDGSHIPVLAPTEGHSDFLNRKGWTSIILQGIVDDKYRFIDISIKYPGRCHDAHVFKNSGIFVNHERMFPEMTQNIDGRNIGYYLIGDPAYPLLSWVMKNFPGRDLPLEKTAFNTALNRSRVTIENSFGRLKSRFRLLSKRADVDYRFMPAIVTACCVLHNIAEEAGDSVLQNWTNEADRLLFPQPQTNNPFGERESRNGSEIRDILCNYVNTVNN